MEIKWSNVLGAICCLLEMGRPKKATRRGDVWPELWMMARTRLRKDQEEKVSQEAES
jgi:hypothetical protein